MISVLIPARNEFLLGRTIDSILESAKGEIEVIAILDGYWPEPIKDDPRVTLIHHTNPVGQRAAVNEAVRIAKGKYILKTDAHSMFDKGFDVKLAASCEYDWTVIPRMYNLHAFDWVCENGHRFYQDKFKPEGGECKDCGKSVKIEWVWKPRLHKKTDFMYMDKNLKVQYWYKYAKRKESKGDIVDIMNGVGACWFQYRERFLELGGLDENHGSWGQVGVEVGCKAWLSGGRHVVNRKTWFAHMFRTTKEFTFPYKNPGKSQKQAEKYSRDLWLNDKWLLAKRPFKWLLEKFQPIPTWEPVKTEKKPLLSVIIPARNEIYLQKTIDDCLDKLTTNFEIIVGLDGYEPELKKDPRVVLCHSERIGMRPMINKMARMAKGKYLMRLDAHCIVDKGIDTELIKCHESGNTVLAMRYELKSSNWTRREKTDCPYRYLSHPDTDQKGGLRGLAWPQWAESHKNEQLGETMTISGSNWLMEREQFLSWGGMDEQHGTFGQEGVEISCMTWLSGGKVLVNKNTWYAHWNRGKTSYALGASEKPKSMKRSIHLWMGDNWPLATRKFQWLIDHFSPVPGWSQQGMRYDYGFKLRMFDVNELYDNYATKHADPNKRALDNPRGAWEFMKVFPPFVENVLNGADYTFEHPYYGYLAKHLNPATRGTEKGHRHVIKKMRASENLCKDIRDNGLSTPLDIWKNGNELILQRGARRIVILKHFGVKEVIARVFKDKQTLNKRKSLLDVRSGGNIERIAIKQFAKKGLRATDKYWKHNYTHLYDEHLNGDRPLNILEIGVKRGSSLLMWKKAFPKAKISGIDIKDVSEKKILQRNRDLKLFVGDQSDTEFLKTVVKHGKFDLIVDDGSHRPDDQLASLDYLWPHVSRGGLYVIEDLWGQVKNQHKRPVIMNALKQKIDDICFERVASVSFYPNICFIKKCQTK
jgi:glycosyltransferase involved in cell wall biosynthesis